MANGLHENGLVSVQTTSGRNGCRNRDPPETTAPREAFGSGNAKESALAIALLEIKSLL
ncbi:MAG: hypothetical protein LKK13_02030 [Bacilli bacterium]|nr:hypothetical protein [Bacilli bacterium]